MTLLRDSGKLPWIVGTVAASGLIFLLVLFVRVTPPQSEEFGMEKAPGAVLSVEPFEQGDTFKESGPLRDPVPLYLPTPVNSGQAEALTAEGRREPVAAFLPFSPKLTHPEAGLRVEFPSLLEIPTTAAQAYDGDEGEKAFRYLGRRNPALAPMTARLGSLQVVRADSGKIVLESDLDRAASSPVVDWAPVELVAAVNQTGLIGLPAIVKGSGVPSFDGWVVRYLASEYRLGQRLGPGIYRISLGP